MVGFLVFIFSAVSAKQCAVPVQEIGSMKPSFGGIDGFLSIAKVMSDGLQSSSDPESYKDLFDLLFGGNASFTQIFTGLLATQIGAIIFWSIGFILVLAAIVLGIAACIWQCCRTCAPKQESVRSKNTGYIFAFLLFTIFVFVLTGVILFNVAQTELTNSIDDAIIYIEEISTDMSNTLVDGTDQLVCEVGRTASTTLGRIDKLIQSYSKIVVDGTRDRVGVTAVDQFDDQAFSAQNTETSNDADKLAGELQMLTSTGQTCTDSMTLLFHQYAGVKATLAGLSAAATGVRSSKELSDINTETDTIKKNIQTQADEVSNTIRSAQTNITNTTGSISNMLNDGKRQFDTVLQNLETQHRELMSSSSYKITNITFRVSVTVPGALGCIFCIVAIAAIILSQKKPDGVAQKMASGVLTTFHTTISLSVTLLLFSSLAFVGGWFFSAICVPIFEDPNYHFFHLLNQTLASSDNSTPNVVNIGELLETCSSPSGTIYKAINGSKIILVDSISEKLKLNIFRDEANKQILSQPNRQFPLDATWQTRVKDLQDHLTKSKNAPVSSCNSASADLAYYAYIKNLELTVQQSNDFYKNLKKLNENAPKITKIASVLNNKQFDEGDRQINETIVQLKTDLNEKFFKCRPLVKIFDNAGFLLCEQFGKPVHGMWASIGLAGICMFSLSILLLLTFRWLKKKDKNTSSKEEKSPLKEEKSPSKEEKGQSPASSKEDKKKDASAEQINSKSD
ncbi:unnamed protein product [Caenorhabditis sp. 36 PRJEB53466]|nr:unnamed protein product [Caenorhabditis sp. 36 PRJEB53466]